VYSIIQPWTWDRGLLLLTLSIYARWPAVSYMQAYITLNPLAGGFIYTKEITINTFNFYTKWLHVRTLPHVTCDTDYSGRVTERNEFSLRSSRVSKPCAPRSILYRYRYRYYLELLQTSTTWNFYRLVILPVPVLPADRLVILQTTGATGLQSGNIGYRLPVCRLTSDWRQYYRNKCAKIRLPVLPGTTWMICHVQSVHNHDVRKGLSKQYRLRIRILIRMHEDRSEQSDQPPSTERAS